jgi:hypothetical protein
VLNNAPVEVFVCIAYEFKHKLGVVANPQIARYVDLPASQFRQLTTVRNSKSKCINLTLKIKF